VLHEFEIDDQTFIVTGVLRLSYPGRFITAVIDLWLSAKGKK
jgi:hypothetical protein